MRERDRVRRVGAVGGGGPPATWIPLASNVAGTSVLVVVSISSIAPSPSTTERGSSGSENTSSSVAVSRIIDAAAGSAPANAISLGGPACGRSSRVVKWNATSATSTSYVVLTASDLAV